jgi:PAS domain S-box-containing protein
MLYEQRFQEFALMGADWFWETDRKGRFTYFSTSATQQGLDLAGLLGRSRDDFAQKDPDNLARLECIDEKVRARESFRNMPYIVDSGNGPPRWCEVSGNPKYDSTGTFEGYRGVGRDITALVEARTALEVQGRTLEAILRSTPDGVHVIDKSNRTLAINDRAFEILGLPAHSDLPACKPPFPIDEAMTKALAKQGGATSRHQLENGRWLEARVRALDDGGMLMLYRDITEDKQRQAELERQSELLQGIFANVAAGIAVYDRKAELIAWNDRALEIVGLDPAVVRIGVTGRELVAARARSGEFGPCVDPEAFADEMVAKVMAGEMDFMEHVRPNGLAFEMRRGQLPGGGSVAIYLDVTERKRSEQEQREAAARLRAVVDTAVDGVMLIDSKGAVQMFNPSCQHLFGYDEAEVIGQNVKMLMPDPYHSEHDSYLESYNRTDERKIIGIGREVVGKRKDGSTFPMDLSVGETRQQGQSIFVGIIRDITERKRAATALEELNETLEKRISERTAELAESDRFQRTLMSNVPGMVYRTNKEGDLWTLEFASEGSRGLIGFPPEELMSGRIRAQTLVHPDERAGVRAKVKADLAVGDSFEAEYRVRRADGKWRWVLDRARAIRSASGEVVALEGVVLDIDDRKMVEQQLHQAQRMEAIGQLTGGLAHDFNNYLAVIMGNLDMLAERGQADPEETKLVQGAISGAQRGAELTRSLLAFSRRQPLDPKVLDPGERIGDVVRLLRRAVGERIALELRVAPNVWPVKIDGAQLDSTMVNLANNARDAMPSGGTVTIEVRNAPADMADAPAGDHVLVEVSDCGIGMDAATLAKAFDPFFSTKGSGRGSGLGLSMVHGFVHQSGGAIRLSSTVGKGTMVRLFLPRSAAAAASLAKPAAAKYPRGTERIILVDDNDAVRETVAETLKSLGYRVTEAVSGDAALKQLEESADAFDLVMSDMVMPGEIDGTALGRIVRDRWARLGILLTTGFAGNSDAAGGGGIADFNILVKPFRKADLARAVRETLETVR